MKANSSSTDIVIHPILGVLKFYFECVHEVNGTFHCGWVVVYDLGKIVLQIILDLLILLYICPIQEYGSLHDLCPDCLG